MKKMTELQKQILAFERNTPRAVKDRHIRTTFGFSPTRYYQMLGRIIDTTDAYKHEPALVGQLLSARAAARARRWPSRLVD